jgi:hypothetical protein
MGGAIISESGGGIIQELGGGFLRNQHLTGKIKRLADLKPFRRERVCGGPRRDIGTS